MQDLAFRYKFSPMAGDIPCGEEISGYLTEPSDCNDVLSEHFVLPINSQVHYPPYNGAIEQAQSELKKGLDAKLLYRPCCPTEHMEAYTSVVA